MRHETALKRLDELDAGQGYGFVLRMHMARCPSCAAAAERIDAALRAYRAEERPSVDEEALVDDRVMAAVRLMPPPQQDFALRDWVLPGAIIAASMFLMPVLGKDIAFLEALFGTGYEFSLALVLGLVFTAYSALFIATHMAELQSFLEKRGLMPR